MEKVQEKTPPTSSPPYRSLPLLISFGLHNQASLSRLLSRTLEKQQDFPKNPAKSRIRQSQPML
jgi:hypothetical protein